MRFYSCVALGIAFIALLVSTTAHRFGGGIGRGGDRGGIERGSDRGGIERGDDRGGIGGGGGGGDRRNSYSNCLKPRRRQRCGSSEKNSDFRTVDGTCNNLRYSTWGASHIPLLRVMRAQYYDRRRLDVPRGYPGIKPILPPANEVCQKLFHVTKINKGNENDLSTLFMTVGQFLDHDITETPKASCKVTNCNKKASFHYPCLSILFKTNDYSDCTRFGRSKPVCRRRKGVREQMNEITSFVDGSQIYSSEKKHFKELRSLDGTGKLKISNKGLMVTDSNINNCRVRGGCSLVGDKRGDENIALHSMHTLWLREHNRIAVELKQFNPQWKEEKLFQTARKITGALWQHIIFEEWLPIVYNRRGYKGYRRWLNPGLTNPFSTAAFRFGHSLVPEKFTMLDSGFNKKYEPIVLRNAFANRQPINTNGIEPIMFGLTGNQSMEVNTEFAHSLVRKLFIPPGQTGYQDLTARNIQRGRDHGLPTYEAYRRKCGFRRIRTWKQLEKVIPKNVVASLKKIYKRPFDIDLYAGGIAENHVKNGIVGPTFACIMRHQFYRLKHGDRFHYRAKGVFTQKQRKAIFKTRMSSILCHNLKGVVSMQKDAFYVASRKNRRVVCTSIPKLELHHWKEGDHSIQNDEEIEGEEGWWRDEQEDKELDNLTAYKKEDDDDDNEEYDPSVEDDEAAIEQFHRRHTPTEDDDDNDETIMSNNREDDEDHGGDNDEEDDRENENDFEKDDGAYGRDDKLDIEDEKTALDEYNIELKR